MQTQGLGLAQITASQGEDPNRLKSFHSPMVLEFPAPGLMQATSLAGWSVKGVQGFNCDGAYFSSLILKVSGKAKNGVTVHVEGALAVGPSFDREATVIVELLVDGKAIGRGEKKKMDAEEGKRKPFRFAFKLSPGGLAAIGEVQEHSCARDALRLGDLGADCADLAPEA